MESAREGIKNVSEKIGKAAGAGMAVVGTAVADVAGYHPSPLITVGAAYTGMKVGGLVGRAMNAGLDRVAAGRGGGGGAIGTMMAQLSEALQILEKVGQEIKGVTDSVNKAQAYFEKASRGSRSNLLVSASRQCRQAPVQLQEGMDEVMQARTLIGEHLVRVASGT